MVSPGVLGGALSARLWLGSRRRGTFRARPASPAARVDGGLDLVYLPVAEEVRDAGEVPQPHPPLMTHARRKGQGGRTRKCRGALARVCPAATSKQAPPRARADGDKEGRILSVLALPPRVVGLYPLLASSSSLRPPRGCPSPRSPCPSPRPRCL